MDVSGETLDRERQRLEADCAAEPAD